MASNNPCDVKVLYDTEFEAEIAASKVSFKLGSEMEAYQCPGTKHWHIANKDISRRSKHRKDHRMYCDICHTYMKPNRWPTHKTLQSHLRKERQGS